MKRMIASLPAVLILTASGCSLSNRCRRRSRRLSARDRASADAHGDVFSADSYSTVVFEYAPGTKTPKTEFETAYTPFEISVHGSTLYVFQSMESGGYASVEIFAHGSTKQTGQLSDSRIVYPQAIAVDKGGNVFVGYGGANFSSGIGEFVGGKGAMQSIDTNVDPLALAIDPNGNLVADVLTGSGSSEMEIYPPGKTRPSSSISGLPAMYEFSFTGAGKSFYAGDMGGKNYQLYSYPAGKLIFSAKAPYAEWGYAGIAASPAAPVGTW